jgi:hypothetical protein
MTTYIRTALLSALVLSLTCGLASASDLRTAANPAASDVAIQAHGGVQPSMVVRCKDPIECSKGRA